MKPSQWKISEGGKREKTVIALREKVAQLIGIGLASPDKCVPKFGQHVPIPCDDMTDDMYAYCLADTQE